MRFFGIFIGFYLFPFFTAAGTNIYFVSGNPCTQGDVYFPSSLYDSRMKEVRTLVPGNERGTEFIRPYYDQRIVIVAELQWRTRGEAKFALIDMDSPKSEHPFVIHYPDSYSVVGSHLFDIPNRSLYQGVRIFDGTSHLFLGMNLKTMKQAELSENDNKYIVTSGFSDTAIGHGDYFDLYYSKEGKPRMGIKGIEMDWIFPMHLDLPEKDRLLLFVNSRSMIALTTDLTRKKRIYEDSLGVAPLYIFDKETKTWDKIFMDGRYTTVQSFGSWLAGCVADEGHIEFKPGPEKHFQKETTATGFTFEARAKYANLFFPGILFLYNIKTKKYFEIQTQQGDSEILLVDHCTVYYRVNDAIYKAGIDYNAISEVEVLARANVVPDIHWAFAGP